VGWPLYKKYGHAHNAFKMVLTDQEDVFEGLDPPVPKQLQAELTEEIKKRLAPQPIKIRADVEVRQQREACVLPSCALAS
jgi:translation initiation factor 2 subunit 1